MGKIKDLIPKNFKRNNISGLDDLEMRILRFRRELANIGEIDELTLKEAKETERSLPIFISTIRGSN